VGRPGTEPINEYLLVDIIPKPEPREVPIWRSLEDASDSETDWDRLDDIGRVQDIESDDEFPRRNDGHGSDAGSEGVASATGDPFQDDEDPSPETTLKTPFDKEQFLTDYISQTAAETFRNRSRPFPLRLFRKISHRGRFAPCDLRGLRAANTVAWFPKDVLEATQDREMLQKEFWTRRLYLAKTEEEAEQEEEGPAEEESSRGRPSS